MDAGLISDIFSITRGVRQEDPLSPLLFDIAIEPYLRLLRSHLSRILISGTIFVTSAYADNTMIGIGSKEDWAKCMAITSTYEKASTALVNKDKSIILPLNKHAEQLIQKATGL